MINEKIITTKEISEPKRIREIMESNFSVCRTGDRAYLKGTKEATCSIITKLKLSDTDYYFVVVDENNNVFLSKMYYENFEVVLKKISKISSEYKQNYDTFESALSEAKEFRKKAMGELFDRNYENNERIVIRKFSHSEKERESGKFVSKHKYRGNYYFIMKNRNDEYVVAKVIWFGFAKLIKLTEKEYEKNSKVFETWISEANKKI